MLTAQSRSEHPGKGEFKERLRLGQGGNSLAFCGNASINKVKKIRVLQERREKERCIKNAVTAIIAKLIPIKF